MRKLITLVFWLTVAVTIAAPSATGQVPESSSSGRAGADSLPGMVFLGDDCSLYRPTARTGTAADSLTVTVFTIRRSRAFPEHDLPAPVKLGRKLFALIPGRSNSRPQLLLDAGRGAIGSPSVTYDGTQILFSMAKEGDSFFHIYRIDASGGRPQQLTDGPFHDIDPVELPDGRIAFASTRIGTFDEYHSAPSRALFVMAPDGSGIRPLTHTIIFDNEPEVLADGRILFIRSDNFFDRAKVETRLHVIHPDGTRGEVAFGIDRSPEYGSRLRAFYCGSPAPMPDGRVAFISAPGITVGWPGTGEQEWKHIRIPAGDVAALPDGRLLCTIGRREGANASGDSAKSAEQEIRYRQIAILDPDSNSPKPEVIFQSATGEVHSPVYLGPRKRPPVLPTSVEEQAERDPSSATGFLFCQDARFTRNTTAGWNHVRAVRVLAAKSITTRSSHSYIVHAGSEVIELGTVPLAPDGSFHIEVPADTPIAFQLVDAEGRSELNEMSWIYVRPGERRSCTGCHSSPRAAPLKSGHTTLALQTPPVKLLGKGDPHRFRGNNAAVTGLMELQFDRFREVAGLNRHDETTDSDDQSPHSDVHALLARLADPDADTRAATAARLALFRDPAAADGLAALLRDDQQSPRIAAAMALAACGTRNSVVPLLKALRHPDPWTAQAADVALENLTGYREPSFHAFDKRNQRLRAAKRWQQWLEQTGWDGVERRLIERLHSNDRDVVRRAAVALSHTGSRRAAVALRAYVDTHRHENPYPTWRAAGHMGDAARFNAQADVNPRTLQAVVRTLGTLRDDASIPLLESILEENLDPATANLFLAEAAIEALGRMEHPRADAVLIDAFAKLRPYPQYTRWYGDHEALMACHVSPLHYFIVESLDRRRLKNLRQLVPHLIRSLPIDPDRALMLETDDYETLVARVIARSGAQSSVVETCLALLGDPSAQADADIHKAVTDIHRCWAGAPTPKIRAAQVLSIVARDSQYESRVLSALQRYSRRNHDIPRVFQTGIPVVDRLPAKNWVCFYLARSLGSIGSTAALSALLESLHTTPPEAATGRPDPLGVGVLFLHNGLTPCWRAAVARAIGEIGDRSAVPALLRVIGDLQNAPDVRLAAAQALVRLATGDQRSSIRKLAEDYPDWATRRELFRAASSR